MNGKKLEIVFSGYTFDAMDYVVQEIKTEMENERNTNKITKCMEILEELTKLSYEDRVILYDSEYGLVLGSGRYSWGS